MITVSLETAKKLKEAGFSLTTELKWVSGHTSPDDMWKLCLRDDVKIHIGTEVLPAPTMQELIKQLPDEINLNGINYGLIYSSTGDVAFRYCTEDVPLIYLEENSKDIAYYCEWQDLNPCNLAAKMWLLLKSEGHV